MQPGLTKGPVLYTIYEHNLQLQSCTNQRFALEITLGRYLEYLIVIAEYLPDCPRLYIGSNQIEYCLLPKKTTERFTQVHQSMYCDWLTTYAPDYKLLYITEARNSLSTYPTALQTTDRYTQVHQSMALNWHTTYAQTTGFYLHITEARNSRSTFPTALHCTVAFSRIRKSRSKNVSPKQKRRNLVLPKVRFKRTLALQIPKQQVNVH